MRSSLTRLGLSYRLWTSHSFIMNELLGEW